MVDILTAIESLDSAAHKLGLDRMKALLPLLGNPHQAYPTLHIAGTNGKGSVSAMLTSILTAHGYRVGTLTSPHLVSIAERLLLNGHPVELGLFEQEARVLWDRLTDQLGAPADNPKWPTYFEFLTLLGFELFRQQQVDVAVVEVGLGGRLDATNVLVDPLVTVVTSIGYDHMDLLGDTLELIAAEKGGIFQAGVPVVLGPDLPGEAQEVLETLAKTVGAHPVLTASAQTLHPVAVVTELGLQRLRNLVSGESLDLHLLGRYQRDNLATVLAVVDVCRRRGLVIEEQAVKAGLRQVHWPGRMQVLTDRPLMIDGSHNADGFRSLRGSLTECFPPEQSVYWLLSLKGNRPVELLLDLLEQAPITPRGVVVTQPEGFGATVFHDPIRLRQAIRQGCPRLETVPIWAADRPASAWMVLTQWVNNHPGSWGMATGSLYTAGQLLAPL